MKWAEVSIQAAEEETDLVASCFYDVGATGVVIEDSESETPAGRVVVKAYLPVDDELDGRIADFRTGIERLAETDDFDVATCPIAKSIVQDSDWENNWKAYFHTQRVGQHIVIQPTWEEYTPLAGDVVLRLDPESAFGTGTHPTTAMCLRALEQMVRGGETVFDVGTGSGVLGQGDGGILLGTSLVPGIVCNSRRAFDSLCERIRKNLERGNSVSRNISYTKPQGKINTNTNTKQDKQES